MGEFVRLGIVILPEYRWKAAKHKWQKAEEYGFDHVWTFDHLGWRSLVDGPWFGAIPTLTAAATVTSRIELGTLVTSPNFRNPITLAREITAIDDICSGRFTVGIGAGSTGDYDTTVFGEAGKIQGRTKRFEEFVELLDRLLTGNDVTYAGEFYSAEHARNAPGCAQEPRAPFVIAANGPRAMNLTARFGQGWITTGAPHEQLEPWWKSIADAVERFKEASAEQGRDPSEVRTFLQTDAAPVYSLSTVECYRDFLGRAERLGFTDVVAPWPRRDGIFAGDESILDTIASEVLARD